jgi:hypothetical protein
MRGGYRLTDRSINGRAGAFFSKRNPGVRLKPDTAPGQLKRRWRIIRVPTTSAMAVQIQMIRPAAR